MAKSHSQKTTFIVTTLFLVFLTFAYAYRNLFGFDWSDESYYSAITFRFLIGDRLFTSSWDIHQLSAIITIPLMYIFRLFNNNSNEGILLFMRIVYIIFQFFTGVYVLRVLLKKHSLLIALIGSALVITFVPFSLASFSYNTMAYLFLILSLFLLYDAGISDKFVKTKHFLGGLLLAFAVLSYLFLIIITPIYIVYYFLSRKSDLKANVKYKPLLFWICGIVFLFGCFISFVFINSSFSNLLKSLPYLLSDPFHKQVSIRIIAISYFKSIYDIFGYKLILILILTIFASLIPIIKNKKSQEIIKTILYASCAVIFISCIYSAYDRSIYMSNKMNFIVSPLVLFGPAIYFLNSRKYDFSIFIYFIGLLFSAAVQIGSNNGFAGSSFALIISSFAVVMYCGKINFDADTKNVCSIKNMQKVLAIIMCIALFFTVFIVRVTGLYRDLPIDKLSKRIDAGPAKGIYTYPESARKYNEVLQAIRKYAPQNGSALYTVSLPFAYLCTNLRYAAPTIATPLNSQRLMDYYSFHPELKPNFIYIINENYGYHNNDNPLDGYMALYIKESDFDKIVLECGIFYIKKS